MAITKVIEIKVDAGHATKSFDKLGDTINEQKKITIEFEEELSKLEQQLKDTSKSSFNLGRADTKKRIEGLKSAIKDQRLGLKKLNLERSNVGALNKNIAQQKKLSETYFESKEGLTDINRLTKEYALKLQAARNILKAAAVAAKKFAIANKTALIATGIGALIVALGVVYTYWEDIKKAVNNTDDAVKDLNITINDTVGLFDVLAGNLESLFLFNDLLIDPTSSLKVLRSEFQELDNAIKRLESTGKDTEENIQGVVDKYREYLVVQKEIKSITDEIAQINEDGDADAAIRIETLELRLAKLFGQKADLKELFKTPDKEEKETKRDPLEKVEGVGFDAEASQREFEAREEANALKLQQELEFNIGLEEIGLTSARIRHDTEIKWADLTAQAKLGIAGAVLQDAAGLVDKNSVAGKGIAIAQTGINTAQGIMQAFATLPTIAAIPAAAIVGALGIKSTLDIAKKKIPSATGRGFVSGGASGGAAAPQAPSFNLVAGTESNQISNDIQGIGQEPVRAVVVSGDVTTGQSVDRNIITESGI